MQIIKALSEEFCLALGTWTVYLVYKCSFMTFKGFFFLWKSPSVTFVNLLQWARTICDTHNEYMDFSQLFMDVPSEEYIHSIKSWKQWRSYRENFLIGQLEDTDIWIANCFHETYYFSCRFVYVPKKLESF